jgi:hypothetical protein
LLAQPQSKRLLLFFSELFPQFVLKLDDHFEDDFASFSEDVGLEDLDVDAEKFRETALPTDDQVLISSVSTSGVTFFADIFLALIFGQNFI